MEHSQVFICSEIKVNGPSETFVGRTCYLPLSCFTSITTDGAVATTFSRAAVESFIRWVYLFLPRAKDDFYPSFAWRLLASTSKYISQNCYTMHYLYAAHHEMMFGLFFITAKNRLYMRIKSWWEKKSWNKIITCEWRMGGPRGSMWPWGCMSCWQPCNDKTQEMPLIPTKSHTWMSTAWPLGNFLDG